MTSRQIPNKQITRSGSTPKLICYSQSIGERTFDYKTNNNKPLEISGKAKAKVKGPDSKETTLFRPLNKHIEPNSIRTLIPESNTIEPIKRSKSFMYSNRESISDVNIKPGHRLRKGSNNPKVYQASIVFNDTYDRSTNGINEVCHRKGNNNVYYKKYNSSQIVSLPGGEKRQLTDINDDTKPVIKRDKGAFTTKIFKDYKSNISCLPGSGVNTNYPRNKIGLSYKYQSTDIFNDNSCSVTSFNRYNYNSFKIPLGKRHLNQPNTESSYFSNQRPIIKCQGYKNISQIQLC